jgi:hypothetical protein
MKARRLPVLSLGLVAVMLAPVRPALACAVCFGAPESPLTRGLGWGILCLLGVVLLVLAGVGAFFLHVARRSSGVRPTADFPELTDNAPDP